MKLIFNHAEFYSLKDVVKNLVFNGYLDGGSNIEKEIRSVFGFSDELETTTIYKRVVGDKERVTLLDGNVFYIAAGEYGFDYVFESDTKEGCEFINRLVHKSSFWNALMMMRGVVKSAYALVLTIKPLLKNMESVIMDTLGEVKKEKNPPQEKSSLPEGYEAPVDSK